MIISVVYLASHVIGTRQNHGQKAAFLFYKRIIWVSMPETVTNLFKFNLRSGVLFSEERESIARESRRSGKATKAWLTADWPPSLALLFFRSPLKKERLIAG